MREFKVYSYEFLVPDNEQTMGVAIWLPKISKVYLELKT